MTTITYHKNLYELDEEDLNPQSNAFTYIPEDGFPPIVYNKHKYLCYIDKKTLKASKYFKYLQVVVKAENL